MILRLKSCKVAACSKISLVDDDFAKSYRVVQTNLCLFSSRSHESLNVEDLQRRFPGPKEDHSPQVSFSREIGTAGQLAQFWGTHWHEVVPIKPRGVGSMSIMGSFNSSSAVDFLRSSSLSRRCTCGWSLKQTLQCLTYWYLSVTSMVDNAKKRDLNYIFGWTDVSMVFAFL